MTAYDNALRLLADPTRRALFERIAARPRTVSELVAEVRVSQPAVSQHLRALREAGLVTVRPEGRHRIYSARAEGLESLRSYVEGLWTSALDAFGRYLEEGGDGG